MLIQDKASILEEEFPCKYTTHGNYCATLSMGSNQLHYKVKPRLFFIVRSVL